MSQTASVPLHAVSRSVLSDIAENTPLDPGLAMVCSMRPHSIAVLAQQVWYVVALAAQLKQCDTTATSKSAQRVVTSRRPRGALAATPAQLQLVVVGGGAAGSKIVETLLDTQVLHPSSIVVVTRQPELLTRFSTRGVRCFPQEEVSAVASADVVVLACQPGQLSAVAKGCASKLSPNALLVSVCCGVSVEKVRSEFNHQLALTTELDIGSLSSVVSSWCDEDAHLAAMPSIGSSSDTSKELAVRRRRALLDVAFPRESVAAAEDWISVVEDPAAGRGAASTAASVVSGGAFGRQHFSTTASTAAASTAGSSYPFIDQLLWCLGLMHQHWCRRAVSRVESFLTAWAVALPPGDSMLCGRIADIFHSHELMKHLKLLLAAAEGGSSTSAEDVPKSPNSTKSANATAAASGACGVTWFAANAFLCSPSTLVDALREQFVQLALD